MTVTLATIVEGRSEVESVPILLRRILSSLQASPVIAVARPFRVSRTRVVREGELERALEQVIRDRSNVKGIIVLLDAEDDDPAALGSRLLDRCRKTTNIPAVVVLAIREFEGWFLGAKESLRNLQGITSGAKAPEKPETIRGAKERLTRNMQPGRRYLEVEHQPAFAEKMDIQAAAARCPSFQRLLDKVKELLDAMGVHS
jgi:hypothetical protein